MNIYIYPDRSKRKVKDQNPYCDNLRKGFESLGHKVISSSLAGLGPLDILLHINSLDIVILNWIEEIPNRKYGYLHTINLYILLFFLSIFDKKVVWTIHNRRPHNNKNLHLIKFIKSILNKVSTFAIIHTDEQLENIDKLVYYPHPFCDIDFNKKSTLLYDILIWGKIKPYKGITEFLSFATKSPKFQDFNILIQGECDDNAYWSEISKYENYNNISLINKYTGDYELNQLFKSSRITLFTHQLDSVLSSGALVKSLENSMLIIGPNVGNFKDFAKENLVFTYENFEQIIPLIENVLKLDQQQFDKSLETFSSRYSWKEYAKFIISKLYN